MKGKQTPGKPITLSAADVKGFENNTEERIREALRAGTEENKQIITGINDQANRFGAHSGNEEDGDTGDLNQHTGKG